MSQGRDFLLEDNGPQAMNSASGRDFLLEDQPQNESLGTSAALAIPRILTDSAKNAYHTFEKIPEYYESLKKQLNTPIDKFSTSMDLNPFDKNMHHKVGQALAGLTELGHGVLNKPHELAQYGENRLNLLPKGFSEKVPYQKDISQDINRVFGQPKYPGEEMIRWGAKNSLNLLGAKGLASNLNPMNLTSKGIAKNVLNKAEEVQNKYSKSYGKLFNETQQKGYSDLSHVAPKIDINTLKKYTPANRLEHVEDFIKNANHETAHFAKSDLLGLQRQLKKETTLTGGQKKQLNAINEAIGSIKDNMFKDGKGNIDTGMLNKYEKLQKGFKDEALPYRINAIKKYQAGDITAGELRNALSKGTFRAKRGFHHPAIAIRKAIEPTWGKVGGAGGGLWLYDHLMGNNPPEQNR